MVWVLLFLQINIMDLPVIFSNTDFSNYKTIYLCDLPITPSTIKILDDHPTIIKKLKHFDHHISYQDDVPIYVNAISELNGRKTCATELFYNYLISLSDKLDKNFYKTYVEATREQDTWNFKEEEYNAKLLANTHAMIGPEAYIELINSLDENKDFKLPKIFDDLYKTDLEKQDRYIKYVDENLLITDYKNYKIGVTISEQYRSIVGDEICKLRPEIDFILIINYSRNTVSLRCVKESIDLNKICLEFHKDGGGHKKAAGFIIDSESIPKIRKYNDMYLENIKTKTKR